jgi:hypothetical protein
MNVPKFTDYDFSIGGRRIEDSAVAYEAPMVAKVVLPGTSEPKVVQTIGDIGEAIVIPPRDPNPRPAEPGSWPPSEADIQAQALANAMREPQLWSLNQVITPKAGQVKELAGDSVMTWTAEDTIREEKVRQQRYERTLRENSEDIDRRLERLGILPRARRLPPTPTVREMRLAGFFSHLHGS